MPRPSARAERGYKPPDWRTKGPNKSKTATIKELFAAGITRAELNDRFSCQLVNYAIGPRHPSDRARTGLGLQAPRSCGRPKHPDRCTTCGSPPGRHRPRYAGLPGRHCEKCGSECSYWDPGVRERPPKEVKQLKRGRRSAPLPKAQQITDIGGTRTWHATVPAPDMSERKALLFVAFNGDEHAQWRCRELYGMRFDRSLRVPARAGASTASRG